MSIQKIESGSTNGYQVRVGPRHAALTKFFAVRKYGGVRKALAVARAAEVMMQKSAQPTSPRDGPRSAAQANNTSGLVGVRPRYTLFSDTPYLYFVASWSKNGKPYSTSFSAEKHGTLGALKLAMERRERATGVRYDLSPRKALNKMKHLIAGH
jgi:AP2 domain